MKRNRICTGQWFVAVLFLAMGLSAYGCSDSVSVLENVEVPLSSLTVTPGSLRPAFLSNTTSYTVNAPTSADSVTVTATPKDSTTTMTINGIPTATGQGRSVLLGPPGSITSIAIVLESLNGTESTYTVNVTRLLSSDNNLSALDVTPGNLNPPFDPDIEDYTATVGVLVDSVTVSATKSDPNASMRIGSVTVPPGTASGQATISLGAPGTPTPVSIEVTAPNGSKKAYRIIVNRAAPSSNNNLSALTITPGALDPAFNAATLSYIVNVAPNVTSVEVSATKADPDAVMSGDVTAGTGSASGQATIPLDGPGTSKVVSITVTAPSGVFKTYSITVNRAAPSSNNNLSALTITPGALDPAFNAATLSYIVNVAPNVTSVEVSATKADPDAVMSGDVTAGTGTASGQATIPLDGPGTSKLVSITVAAPSGAFKTYSITVNRLSSDNNLSALTVTPGSLFPDFASSTTTYTVDAPFSVDSVTVSATKADPNAVMSGDVTAGTGVATGEATFQLFPLIPRSVSITVTATNGESKTYTITITRALF
jgi:hypothetical protein